VIEILLLASITLDSRDRWNKTPRYNSLTQYSGKSKPTITQILLLVGDAPLDGADQFSVHVCHRLKTLGFNPDTFQLLSILKKGTSSSKNTTMHS
jgi:hypothetical protein